MTANTKEIRLLNNKHNSKFRNLPEHREIRQWGKNKRNIKIQERLIKIYNWLLRKSER
jgi:hypothetical protein